MNMSEKLFIALYTDEHVPPALVRALRQRGYKAQSTGEAGTEGWTDADQLFYAAERGMAILTYNVSHFAQLARKCHQAGREHAGIILSRPFTRREFGELLRQTLRLLNTLTADEMQNSVVYLQQFR